jgi:hypothetical protein
MTTTMFRKLFGGKKKNKQQRRLSSTTAQPADGMTRDHPMYTYAMKEYAQTVPAETSNDDGHIRPKFSMQDPEDLQTIIEEDAAAAGVSTSEEQGRAIHHHPTTTTTINDDPSMRHHYDQQQAQPPASQGTGDNVSSPYHSPNGTAGGAGRGTTGQAASTAGVSVDVDQASVISAASTTNFSRTRSSQTNPTILLSPKTEYIFAGSGDELQQLRQQQMQSPSSTSTTRHRVNAPASQSRQQSSNNVRFPLHPNDGAYSAMMEPTMPDTTYEESYGDGYVGGPIRYIYPSGYQSMRPRSGPWKLSIVVCLCFTWLSIFVIGHCSDKYNENGNGAVGGDTVYQYYKYNEYNANNNQQQEQQIDDDEYNIETKWCGSRLLYWMWVISMLITGLATAYCSVIGYIKVRDFAVANVRSQPPGVLAGGAKSDYYVQITGSGATTSGTGGPPGRGGDRSSSSSSLSQQQGQYNKTIYQADGNPQFWGNQIYRPTQAAVAITSR